MLEGETDMGRPARDRPSAPQLTPITAHRESVSQQVIQSLTEYFFSGGVAPGEKLPSERQLAESLGVTRSAVRDAVQSLGLIGALDIRQGDGMYLRQGASGLLPKAIQWGLFLGETPVLDLVEARSELEVVMAGFAATRRSEPDLERLGRLIEEMAAADLSTQEFVELDLAFHAEIATIARNTILRDVLSSVTGLLRAWMTRSIRAAGETDSTTDEHRGVLAALTAGDPDDARAAMTAHMVQARARLARTMEQKPAPGDVARTGSER